MNTKRPIDQKNSPLAIAGAALMVLAFQTAEAPQAGAQQYYDYYPPAPQGTYYQSPYQPRHVAPTYQGRRHQQKPRASQSSRPSQAARRSSYTPAAQYSGSVARAQQSAAVTATRQAVADRNTPSYREGGDVEQAQRQLAALGYDPGTPDGILGPNTLEALRQFQKSRNIKEDKPLGPLTQEALNKEASAHASEVIKETTLGRLMSADPGVGDSGAQAPAQAATDIEAQPEENNTVASAPAEGTESGAANAELEAIPAPVSANPFHSR